MLASNSFKLIFSLLLALSISSSSLAQTSPEQPTNNQTDINQYKTHKLPFNTINIQAPDDPPIRVENVSKDYSWIISVFSGL
ncbi:MAG: hypothetical protein F6K55_26285 [Moorea sp. SIO4A3]|nr:hypothetical protein [Moorena sp. SIO4A3]